MALLTTQYINHSWHHALLCRKSRCFESLHVKASKAASCNTCEWSIVQLSWPTTYVEKEKAGGRDLASLLSTIRQHCTPGTNWCCIADTTMSAAATTRDARCAEIAGHTIHAYEMQSACCACRCCDKLEGCIISGAGIVYGGLPFYARRVSKLHEAVQRPCRCRNTHALFAFWSCDAHNVPFVACAIWGDGPTTQTQCKATRVTHTARVL